LVSQGQRDHFRRISVTGTGTVARSCSRRLPRRVCARPARDRRHLPPLRRRQLPPAGTRHLGGDHLASGLVPIAILVAVAAIYPRLRAGARAATAMTLGAIGITIGVTGAYYLVDGTASGDQ
jgi:hypothetical protein